MATPWQARLRIAACGLLLSGAAHAAVMTNKDVVSLLEAGMSEDVVLQAIRTSDTKFDTSANALIQLKRKGATPAILKAMMSPGQPAAAPSGQGRQSAKIAASGGLNPEEVLVVVDGTETPMSYIVPQTRTAARALGFGGVGMYAVLRGTAAQRRLSSSPEFIVSVPKNAQAPDYITLANFAVRRNGSREVLIGGGYMSISTGIHRDRIVKIIIEPLPDQSRAKEGFVLHRVIPETHLPSGEYSLVLYSGEVRVAGFFPQGANSYFDFGVD